MTKLVLKKLLTLGYPKEQYLDLFFIIYMNDLLLKMPKGSILSYADDTVIITDDNTWYHAQDRMNDLLNKVAK